MYLNVLVGVENVVRVIGVLELLHQIDIVLVLGVLDEMLLDETKTVLGRDGAVDLGYPL